MGTNAPGQLLGYTLQYPRALWHLLKCDMEDVVCIEEFGDVGVTKEDQSKISEEDKSSQNGNPVTDRSTDLWKTFFNWAKLILDGTLDLDHTIFILYANKKGRAGIVNSLSAADDIKSAKACIASAWDKLKKIDAKHEIFPYIDFLKKNETIFEKMVVNFDFIVGSGAGGFELKQAIKAKHVADSQVEYLQISFLGWLQQFVTDKLANKLPAIISWKEFDVFAKTAFESARKRELIDFALVYPPSEDEVNEQKRERPPYIQQIDAIGGDDDDVQEAVTAYLKAKVNLFNWIEKELIDEETAIDFEDKLTLYWKNQHKTVHITHSSLSEELKGKVVYSLCRDRQQLIKNQDPPAYTIAGTYHLMSNNLTIGWHPKWKETFLKTKTTKDE